MDAVYTDRTRSAARQYLKRGLFVIPVPATEKNPNRTGWQNERHTLNDVKDLWNNGQGIGLLWGEPAGGRVDVDCDWPEARIAAKFIMPETKTFGRPGAPESHYVMRPTDGVPTTKRYKIGTKGDDRSVVELLSTGAQSLVPPSLHDSGEERIWYSQRPAAEIDTKDLLERVADIATAAFLARNWPGQGARKDYCMAAAGYIGRRLPRERAQRVMEAAVEASGDEEAQSRLRDVEDTLDKIERDESTTGGPTLDDLAPGVTETLNRWHKWSKQGGSTQRKGRKRSSDDDEQAPTHDELRDRFLSAYPDYGYGLQTWRHYRDGVWPKTDELTVQKGVSAVLEEAKPEKVKPTLSLVNSVTGLARIKTSVPDEVWDSDPDILVCTNGALRLSTRELLPHSKKYYATTGVPYAFDPEATSEVWLERVMGELIAEHHGLETVDFLQEFAGYCLTTDTSHEIALWLHGKHGGGRSTVLEGLRSMLGEGKAGVLSLSQIERSSFAMTNLPGKTLVTSTEQPSLFLRGGGVLNAIISGETVQVDIKHKDPIEVTPRCKIAWAMNELPRVGDRNDGIFRRVKVLDVPEIPPEHQDPQVKEEVKLSGAGILNWGLDGLERLLARGHFKIPEAVQEATAHFKATNDVPAMFVSEECEEGPNLWEATSNLYEAYSDWCEKTGHRRLTSTKMAEEWKRLGYERWRTETGVRWRGLKLRNEYRSAYKGGM